MPPRTGGDILGLPSLVLAPTVVLRPGDTTTLSTKTVVSDRPGQALVAGEWIRVG